MQSSFTCAFAGARACRKRRGRYMRGHRTRMVTIADEVDGEARRPARPAVFASSTRSGSAASPADDVGAVLFAQGGASREQAIPARVAPGVCVAVSLLAYHGSHRRKSERAVLATTSFCGSVASFSLSLLKLVCVAACSRPREGRGRRIAMRRLLFAGAYHSAHGWAVTAITTVMSSR